MTDIVFSGLLVGWILCYGICLIKHIMITSEEERKYGGFGYWKIFGQALVMFILSNLFIFLIYLLITFLSSGF